MLFPLQAMLGLILFFVAVALGDDAAFTALLRTYEESQNTLNISMLASVWDKDATIYLPAGEPSIEGIDNIVTAYKGFFSSLASLHETLLTPFLIHNDAAGYSKLLSAVMAANGCQVVLPAVQTFQFNNASGLLSGMSVVYNTTDFGVQAACTK